MKPACGSDGRFFRWYRKDGRNINIIDGSSLNYEFQLESFFSRKINHTLRNWEFLKSNFKSFRATPLLSQPVCLFTAGPGGMFRHGPCVRYSEVILFLIWATAITTVNSKPAEQFQTYWTRQHSHGTEFGYQLFTTPGVRREAPTFWHLFNLKCLGRTLRCDTRAGGDNWTSSCYVDAQDLLLGNQKQNAFFFIFSNKMSLFSY